MARTSFFSAVSEDDERRLRQRCTRSRFGAGAYVFHAGEAGDSLHIIAKGKVGVLAGGRLGEPLMLDILQVGETFGDLALIGNDHHRTATIKALEPTETLVLRRADFDDLRASTPSVNQFLMDTLVRQVNRLSAQLVELAETPAPIRVYRRIVHLADVYRATVAGAPIPVTQDQLASMAYVKLRITNRVISDARRDGVLDTGRRVLIVLDPSELNRRAQLDRTKQPT